MVSVLGSHCTQEGVICYGQSMAFGLDFNEQERDISAMASVSRKKSSLACAGGLSSERR